MPANNETKELFLFRTKYFYKNDPDIPTVYVFLFSRINGQTFVSGCEKIDPYCETRNVKAVIEKMLDIALHVNTNAIIHYVKDTESVLGSDLIAKNKDTLVANIITQCETVYNLKPTFEPFDIDLADTLIQRRKQNINTQFVRINKKDVPKDCLFSAETLAKPYHLNLGFVTNLEETRSGKTIPGYMWNQLLH